MKSIDASKDWTAKYDRNVCIQENYIELMKECAASGKKKKKKVGGTIRSGLCFGGNLSLLIKPCQKVL